MPINSAILLPFVFGFVTALAIGAAVRVLLGMRLNLQLVNMDSPFKDQSIIPVTSENKKSFSLLHTLLTGNWREDIEIVLADNANKHYSFLVGYHWWWRFYIIPLVSEPVFLNHKKLAVNKKHYVKTGMHLNVGDRAFTVLISTATVRSTLHKELAAHFEESSSDLDV